MHKDDIVTKLRWGILSTARIGTEKVIPALQASRLGEVVAIASREPERAERAASALGIPTAYGSYEELLADERVDAVYNPLPNHMHVPWSIRCLEAGKHVLCEKPIGLSSTEAMQLVDAAARHPKLKIMEAFMYRFHPQWQTAYQLVREERIGRLTTIQTFFSYYNDDPQDIRNRPEMGGGALMDIGCYPISLSRWLFDSEPIGVTGTMERDPQFGVDRLTSAILQFPTGSSSFTCGTQLTRFQRVQIVGDRGRIEIEMPFNPPADRPTRLWHQTEQTTQEIVLDPCDQYTVQGDLFAEAVMQDREVPTPLFDAVSNMHVIEAVNRTSWRRPELQ